MIAAYENRLSHELQQPGLHVAVPIERVLTPVLANEVVTGASVAELRIDKVQPCSDEELFRQALRYGSIPVLATIRIAAEGGRWIGSADERKDLFRAITPYSDGCDIEAASELCKPDFIHELHDRGQLVIASMHDFAGTPSTAQLQHRYYRAMEQGADYFKVATRADDEEAYTQLTKFVFENEGDPIIVVAMGEYGPQSRVELPIMGSRLTYAYVGDEPVAPGQLHLSETKRRYDLLTC